jgi:hypothetical protein
VKNGSYKWKRIENLKKRSVGVSWRPPYSARLTATVAICGTKLDPHSVRLSVFLKDRRRTVHAPTWIARYRTTREMQRNETHWWVEQMQN